MIGRAVCPGLAPPRAPAAPCPREGGPTSGCCGWGAAAPSGGGGTDGERRRYGLRETHQGSADVDSLLNPLLALDAALAPDAILALRINMP